MKSKTAKLKSKALAISTDTYNKVAERDNYGCAMCQTHGIHEGILKCSFIPPLECHHYINRSHSGLGIEENLIMLCQYHHKEETKWREQIKAYLQSKYSGWNKDDLIFKK